MSEAEKIAAGLPGGARRACLAMTDQWQFCGKQTFNANGAWSLHWFKGGHGRGAIAEMELLKDGKWFRYAYRLTPLGLEVRKVLERQS
jgi:hypothetical protein